MSRTVCQPLGGAGKPPREHPVEERLQGLEEVVQGWSRVEASAEAARCLASHPCTFCEVCQLLCPDLCITRDPATGDIQIALEHCKGCGLCAHFCPKGAIRMVLEDKGQ